MIKVSACHVGRLFGVGLVSAVALACSGSSFKTGTSSLDQGGTDTTDSVNLEPRGGKSATGGKPSMVTGGMTSEAEGGAPAEQHPLPSAAGSNAGGSVASGGTGGAAAGMGGVGGNVVPPDGEAGEPNIPDPPIDPNCAVPIAEAWNEALSEDADWHVGFGDPSVDTVNHRLVLTYDDVAERTKPYVGSYYMESDVTIEGSTVFTPYPYTFEVYLPSMRRNAAGTGIELGATQYGPSSWTATGWGTASGTAIAGTTKLHVSLYMQVASKAFAVKVSYGNKVYRSEWVTDFHWAKTDLGIMRYTGENNSGVYAGGGNTIYVAPVSGCQKLSDAAVETLFKN